MGKALSLFESAPEVEEEEKKKKKEATTGAERRALSRYPTPPPPHPSHPSSLAWDSWAPAEDRVPSLPATSIGTEHPDAEGQDNPKEKSFSFKLLFKIYMYIYIFLILHLFWCEGKGE